MLFDSHAHLDDPRFGTDREQVINEARKSGVLRIINVGAGIESSLSSLELARKHDFIFSSCGVHPHEASSYNDEIEGKLREIARDGNTVAIGETGLDYYYDNSPRETQKTVFARQIRLAGELSLPLIIHCRDAHKDCLDLLKSEKADSQTGVFHCYSGSAEMVRDIVGMGFYVSFTGVVTFKNARKTIEAVKAIPSDRLLVETDCPYMPPEPMRGKRNVPEYIKYTAAKLAEIQGRDYEEMCGIFWDNTHRLFSRLPKDTVMVK
ncbi:MAG: TatD family hydrolase [Clostridia bacterium]|nr:TatD family hydrolase [Clostridia bacterium]